MSMIKGIGTMHSGRLTHILYLFVGPGVLGLGPSKLAVEVRKLLGQQSRGLESE